MKVMGKLIISNIVNYLMYWDVEKHKA